VLCQRKSENAAAERQDCGAFNTLRTGVRYIRTSISAEKTAVFACLTNVLAPPPIALESCSRPQTDRPV